MASIEDDARPPQLENAVTLMLAVAIREAFAVDAGASADWKEVRRSIEPHTAASVRIARSPLAPLMGSEAPHTVRLVGVNPVLQTIEISANIGDEEADFVVRPTAELTSAEFDAFCGGVLGETGARRLLEQPLLVDPFGSGIRALAKGVHGVRGGSSARRWGNCADGDPMELIGARLGSARFGRRFRHARDGAAQQTAIAMRRELEGAGAGGNRWRAGGSTLMTAC